MRTFLKIIGVFIGLIIVIIILALQRVDYTPYFESDYYMKSKSRLDSISKQLTLAEGKIQVGFGKASITPGFGLPESNPELGLFENVPLAGFGSRKGNFVEGVHDSLFVKAVAVEVNGKILVLVGSDMLIIPPNLSSGVSHLVEEKTGLNRNQIFFSATHTHSSVGAWSNGYVGKEFAGDPNPEVVNWLIQQFTTAIKLAVEDLTIGEIGVGSFDAPDLIRNRLVGELGEKNPEFIMIKAQQIGGKKAIIGSFDAHATMLGGWNMEFSADYPGFWQRKMEENGMDMAVFIAGSVGSHSAVSQGEKFDKPAYIGNALADSVIKYSESIEMNDSIGLSFLSLKMDLPEFHIRVSDGIRLNPGLGERLFPDIGEVYVQVARIGDLIWATSPSDFSGEFAIEFKNAMHSEGYKALVTSFNGGYVGYIIPGRYYHLNEYESRLMSWFGPNMGPYSFEMMKRMMLQLTAL